MIFLAQSTTTLDSALYLATKTTDIPMISLSAEGVSEDYCACLNQCVPCLKAFTDEVGSDYYKNDLFQQYLNIASSGTVEIRLIKISPLGVETTYIVTDGTYGSLTNGSAATPRYYEYVWDFFKIWEVRGYGKYRFEMENINTSSRPIQALISPTFCLQRFSAVAAHRTIRIETEQTGRIKNGNNYGILPFFQQIRLPGALSLSSINHENDHEQLNNDVRSLIQIKDQINLEYKLRIDLVSAPQSMMTIFDYLFANSVKVSDFNVLNFVADAANKQATAYRSIPLKRSGTEFDVSSKKVRKSFTFTMEYARKNIYKTNN